ncbi:hypothetical protein SAMN05518801_10526 [Novosphingobium sp. CF614]|uniref:hypothetical protein n=1 Tax=Novosphingobium sp. CF614 TaxID=1884364 RepID=UPI0008E479DA|nr:hypothetical protein [Novosphingobium sp. CF614]SFF98863.1 hypothetical protein SAMN05518801_10526 [Novosphingobium sp. CF614]
MSEHHAFASLSPRLLARKGSAKPAMRPQDTVKFADSVLPTQAEDLGWDDWGHGQGRVAPSASDLPEQGMPEVLRQIEQIAWRINRVMAPAAVASPESRRTAFTLRLDAERHFRLRMAGVVLNRSAQVLVTEALDKYLSEIPQVAQFDSTASKQC